MVDWQAVRFILSFVLQKVALLMAVPALYAWMSGSAGGDSFLQLMVMGYAVAWLLRRGTHVSALHLRVQELFISTTAAWVLAAGLGALPFLLISQMTFTDAFFETLSGLTTTGSSVIRTLATVAPSLLLWRSLLQWIGGIGFMVAAVAILPFLNVGGMHLFHTEFSDRSEKHLPRMRDIAKQILAVYVALTLLCYSAFYACGMSHFTALNHALTTVSTGGFSTTDSSIAGFSTSVHWTTTLFMLLSSFPLLLVAQMVLKRELRFLYQNQQVRGLLGLLLIFCPVLSLWLWYQGVFPFADSVRLVCFNLVNILSSTGYALGQFDAWTPLSTLVFLFLLPVGGCAGSTAGGIKLFRLQICLGMCVTQIKRLIHPSAVAPQRYNGDLVTEEVARSVVAFMVAFGGVVWVIAMVLACCGIDLLTALTGAMTAAANVGPGLGARIGPLGNFADLPVIAKWALAAGMLLGRLEVMTVLVLLSPQFWKN